MQSGGNIEERMDEMTIIRILKRMHLYGTWRRVCLFAVNRIIGTGSTSCAVKRGLLRAAGFSIGRNTVIVGPIYPFGDLTIGSDCWIGRNMTVHGNGSVVIGDRCDIAPDVRFLTGSHEIGGHDRRAGEGRCHHITVGNGVWIGAGATVLGDTQVGDGAVVAACACVVRNVSEDTVVGGVPAKTIRSLENESERTDQK